MTNELVERGPRAFTFGPFVLIPERQTLLERGSPIRLGGRALDILTVLVSRAGELVSKRELLARVWPNTVVEEGNVKVNMAALRRALGDVPGTALYIATVAGRGYRFVATVRTSGATELLRVSPARQERNHNLPSGTARLLGRGDAIAAIRGEIEGSRLVSLVGAGGIGKTTVALAVAERAAASFADGAWLVDLSVLQDSSALPGAVAAAMGASIATSTSTALCAMLHDREMLLVFDNCEHLIDAAAVCIARILADTPRIRVLVTSREPLRVQGERVRRLPPLVVPASFADLDAAHAMRFSAIQLFVACATDTLESYRFGAPDVAPVAEICRRLDGVPLAIELAATTIDASGAAGLLQHLDDPAHHLAARRAGPARHRSLKAAIDWSLDLLTSTEAALLRAVSVFAGEFDRDGASAVSGIPSSVAGDILCRLVAKSVVASEATATGMAYRLFRATRLNGLERLRARHEHADACRRHAEYVCSLLERSAHDAALVDDVRNAVAWAEGDVANAAIFRRLTVAGSALRDPLSTIQDGRIQVARAARESNAAVLSARTGDAVSRIRQGVSPTS